MSPIDEAALAWIAKQAAGPLSDADKAAFDAWHAENPRHRGAYLRAQAIWHTLDKATIQPNLRPQPPARKVLMTRRTAIAAGMAAVAAGLGALLLPRRTPDAVLTTTMGEFRKVPLPDKSIASLNSGSHVEVKITPKLRRVVLVEGEAWFEVAKNPEKPFVVEAGAIRVQAVGTAFSVRRRDGGADVLVTEGIVEVWSEGGSEGSERRRLQAGDEAFVPSDATAIRVAAAPAEVERKLAWREGNIVLDNETLDEAAAEFNRYNGQKITIADPAVGRTRFVGQYRIDQPAQFAQSVQAVTGAKVSIEDGSIVIGPPAA
ncbi:FecR family protein [Asticcacaulis solisilvae]|uniref:FecR family protein n=1 Tax=Asticcacaulis solisilvae TaxID=1217274 RepID=UPI003FD731A9